MDPLQAVATILTLMAFVAWLAESSIEYFLGLPFEKIAALNKYRPALPYLAAVIGIVLALFYKFDLVALLSQFIGQEANASYPGIILTGLAISRGSEFLHGIAKRYFLKVQE